MMRLALPDRRGIAPLLSPGLPADELLELYRATAEGRFGELMSVLARLREATADGPFAADLVAGMKERVSGRREVALTEPQKLPVEIATLAAEGKRLVETIAELDGPARRLVDDRLKEMGEQLAHREVRLVAVERELANIEDIAVEASWIAECLTKFDLIWGDLTPENRARLLRAMIQRVDVDEPSNKVSVVLGDVDVDQPGAPPAPDVARPPKAMEPLSMEAIA